MRSHGVPSFPDPASGGVVPKAVAQQLGVSDSRLQAAQSACQHLLPAATSFQQQARQCLTAGACPQALVQQMLTADRAFARCMRSHGVPRYPDPGSGNELANGLPKVSPQQLGVSDAQYQAAQGDCAHLLPNGGQQTQTQSQRDLDVMRGYARCMRSHGVPTWPDPTFDPTAGWGFNLVGVHGFDPDSQEIDDKMNVCDHGLPPGIGVPLSRPGHPG